VLVVIVYNTTTIQTSIPKKSTALPYHNLSILQIRGQRMPTLIPIPGDIPQRNHIRSTSNVADYAVITQSETSAQTNTKTSRPSKSGSNSSQDSEQVLPTDLLDENPSLVKLPSQLQNLLHVYKFIPPDLNLKNSIKPVPQASNCELRGSGPDELNAPYKVNGQAFNIYDFYAKRHEIADAIEMSITAFSSWYENLRFSDALHLGLAEDNLYQWRFKVIFISKAPTTCEGKSSPPSLKYSWALKMAGDFYKSIFNRNKDDAKSIDYALLHSPSIMIVAAQCKGNTPLHFHTLKGGHHRKAARVVACMTYDTGEPEVNSDELPPILILWLAVSDDTQHAPIAFDKTWRRQGFALFLLIHAIKSCCVLKPTQNADTKTPCAVNVYLQCTQSAAYHFYLSCGFGQINKGNDDGRMSLNTSLQKLLDRHPSYWIPYCQKPSDYNDEDSVQELPPCKLMHLQPGHLRHPSCDSEANQVFAVASQAEKPNTSDALNDPRNVQISPFQWCYFPIPSRGLKEIYSRLTATTLNGCFLRLHCLNNLIPSGEYRGLLPAASLRLNGSMSASRRLLHSRKKQDCWFQTDEIELMLSLILRDGRYDDYVATIPPIYAPVITQASSAHLTYTNLCRFLADARKNQMSNREIDSIVRKQFNGKTAQQISAEYSEPLNFIIKNVIVKNPGMLFKHLIVFPWCMDEQHWVVTFIFNPNSILSGASYLIRTKFVTTINCDHVSFNSVR
jgi:hypothetical protein